MCTNLLKQKILKNNKHICAYCNKKLEPSEITLDHVLPVMRGGEDLENNLVIACKDCNTEKSCLTKEEFMEYKKLTQNCNLFEKLYVREIFLYCIFNNIKINSISVEKFLMLNKRDNFLQSLIFKINNENNEYKKIYTKATQEYISLEQRLEKTKEELVITKNKNNNLSKKLKEDIKLAISETDVNSIIEGDIEIEDIMVAKLIEEQLKQVQYSKKYCKKMEEYKKGTLKDKAIIYFNKNKYLLLDNINIFKVYKDNNCAKIPCKIIKKNSELSEKQFNLITKCNIFRSME